MFEKARLHPGEQFAPLWNLYVDASKAFVLRDKASLLAAREKLAKVPIGHIKGATAVPNLNVVDGLLACFERPYSDAYGRCVKRPDRVTR